MIVIPPSTRLDAILSSTPPGVTELAGDDLGVVVVDLVVFITDSVLILGLAVVVVVFVGLVVVGLVIEGLIVVDLVVVVVVVVAVVVVVVAAVVVVVVVS